MSTRSAGTRFPRVPDDVRDDIEILWNFHDVHHAATTADVGIVLGCHDLGVATCAARLYHEGAFPLLVITGANSVTTRARFPRGEAVHYREHAMALGVPDRAILLESRACNTGENIALSRILLACHAVVPATVALVTRPYHRRRALATCRRQWPAVDVWSACSPLGLDAYVESIGDPRRVVDMVVGDTQRLWLHAEAGFAEPDPVPGDVRAAFERLVTAGYTSRLL